MNQIEIINRLLRGVPDNQLTEIIDFVMFLKLKSDKAAIEDIGAASTSSTGFWDNADDEVWDYV